jgi:virginiamycin B lyase
VALALALALLGAGSSSASGATTSAGVAVFPIPTANSGVAGLAAAPNGAIWFAETTANKIGTIEPSGQIQEQTVPTANSGPSSVAVAPDGTVWFTESQAAKIAEIPTSGPIQEYPIPAGAEPGQITIGPDGDPWFTEPAADQIGTLRHGAITSYPVPTANASPNGIISAGPGDDLYFTEQTVSNELNFGTVTTTGGFSAEALPFLAGEAGSIALAADGSPWFTVPGQPLAGSLIWGQSTGAMVPPGTSDPEGIAVGVDGNIWFSSPASGTIGWLAPKGPNSFAASAITEYQVAANQQIANTAMPNEMVAGAGGTLWFSEPGLNEIERGTLAAPLFAGPSSLQLTAGQAVNQTITAGGWPTPALTQTGTLPPGLSFHDNGDGTATISGTPATADGGQSYTVTVTASNSFQSTASQTIAISVGSATTPTGTATTTTGTGTTAVSTTTTSTTATGTGAPNPALAVFGAQPPLVTKVAVSHGTVRMTISCGSVPCTVDARLSIAGRRTTVTSLTLGAGQQRTITLRPGHSTAKSTNSKKLKATLMVVQSASGGWTRTIVQRTVVLAAG